MGDVRGRGHPSHLEEERSVALRWLAVALVLLVVLLAGLLLWVRSRA